MKPNNGPLTGIRVLDVSTMIAAPFGASLLGDLGAEIIKVELPGRGDTLRNVGPWNGKETLRWPGMSRNKKSITLDIRTEEGKQLFKQLTETADVLIENFRPGTLEKWSLGYDELKKSNAKLIMVRVSGYGQTGPYRNKAGFGTPATAFSGYTYLQGYKDRPPVTPSLSLLDYLAGIFAAFAAVSALFYQEKNHDPEGQVAEFGLYEPMIRMMEFLIAEYDQTGSVRERSPGLEGHSSPAGTFETKDGRYVVLVTSTDSTFARLAAVMGREDMLADPRYCTNSVRLVHDPDVEKIVSEWIRQYDQKTLVDLLDSHGVPVSPIYSIADIFRDPQYQARENIVEVEHPRLGKIKVPGVVPKFSKTPGVVRHRAPELGEHNEEIFAGELGLSRETLKAFHQKGVI
ncbi:CoA transferase [Sporolactobacillus sp. CQH2019]|uniref:CaiB/BaiF CoA transferase family protein n=1 Tax=Sporolactobacillus sp. CQH2019 TaxID=3023512 RepID=UPI002367836D|nr:CoA transferase [Sporolactobacillus sp. CQH2019]MDD9148017.1 CoA transferase [Sporolactobacillus sp. CQH2019]